MKKSHPKHIAVIYSLPSSRTVASGFREAEDDTATSAETIAQTLRDSGYSVTVIPLSETTIDRTISLIRADMIFNYIEWTGRDLPFVETAFMALEKTGIPYTGASLANYLETTDKVLMKKAFKKSRIPSPQSYVFDSVYNISVPKKLTYPAIVKVSREHSGVGLSPDSLVSNMSELGTTVRKRMAVFKQPILVEEYIDGRDLEVTLFDTASGVVVCPPAENVFSESSTVKFMTYGCRWETGSPVSSRVVTADIPVDVRQRIDDTCRLAYKALGFRDYARFDLRLRKDNSVFVIETNSNPGLDDNPENGLAVSFHAGGYSFRDFLLSILSSCAGRHGTQI